MSLGSSVAGCQSPDQDPNPTSPAITSNDPGSQQGVSGQDLTQNTEPTLTPTPTPTATPTPTPTPTATATPTPTPSSSPSPTPIPTPIETPSPTPTPSDSPLPTPTPSTGPSVTPTPDLTLTPTPTPSLVPDSTPTLEGEGESHARASQDHSQAQSQVHIQVIDAEGTGASATGTSAAGTSEETVTLTVAVENPGDLNCAAATSVSGSSPDSGDSPAGNSPVPVNATCDESHSGEESACGRQTLEIVVAPESPEVHGDSMEDESSCAASSHAVSSDSSELPEPGYGTPNVEPASQASCSSSPSASPRPYLAQACRIVDRVLQCGTTLVVAANAYQAIKSGNPKRMAMALVPMVPLALRAFGYDQSTFGRVALRVGGALGLTLGLATWSLPSPSPRVATEALPVLPESELQSAPAPSQFIPQDPAPLPQGGSVVGPEGLGTYQFLTLCNPQH